MNNEKLYYYDGSAKKINQTLAFNSKKTTIIKDIGLDIQFNNIKKINIRTDSENLLNLHMDSYGTISFNNKKVVIQDKEDMVNIIVINTVEQLNKYKDLLSKQEFQEVVDYILEYSPDLFTQERLQQKSIEELKMIKEKIFELANSY